MGDTMRAAQVVEVGRIVCDAAPVFEPEPGEVIVRNHMAAICGSDVHQLYFDPFDSCGSAAPGWPGHEAIGEIAESDDPALQPGDAVLTIPGTGSMRSFADFQTLHARWCLKLPDYDGPAEDLMMAQQFGTTIHAVRRGGLDFAGKTVAVLGQGSAGQFFSWQAKHDGAATVVVSDLSPARLAQSDNFGADIAVLGDDDGAAVHEAVMDSTGGRGADIVIEAVGRAETVGQAIDIAAERAMVTLFGLPDRRETIPVDYRKLFAKQLTTYTVVGAQGEADLDAFHSALDWIARREIDVSRMISHRLPIEDIERAMALAHERDEDALKVTLTF